VERPRVDNQRPWTRVDELAARVGTGLPYQPPRVCLVLGSPLIPAESPDTHEFADGVTARRGNATARS
jgi:hypothetical protein